MNKAKISFAVLLMLPMAVLSAPTFHTAKIKAIYPQSTGAVYVSFYSDDPECTSASNPDYYLLQIGVNGVTQEGFKNMYSALLAGASAGKNVTINFENGDSQCAINRVSVEF